MYPFFLESILGDKMLIPMYGVFLALAFTLSYVQSVVGAMKRRLDPKHIENLFLIIVLSSVIGSRGFHVLFENFSYFREHPWEIFYFWQGGFTFYGALIVCMITSVSYTLLKKLEVPAYADVAAPPVLLGLFVGRIGCFFAGCCWGKPTDMPWGVSFTHAHTFAEPRGVPLHPTQLYESFLCLLIYLHLLRLTQHRKYKGQITVHALVLYAVVRIFVEVFRGDSYRGFLLGDWLSTSQFISLGILALGIALARHLPAAHPPRLKRTRKG